MASLSLNHDDNLSNTMYMCRERRKVEDTILILRSTAGFRRFLLVLVIYLQQFARDDGACDIRI